MAYTKLIPRHTLGADIEKFSSGERGEAYRFSISAGSANKYRLAQLDDYPQLKRSQFSWHSPFSLSLSARTSSESIPGTWGFGLWNDPFGLSLGFGGNRLRLPTLPNAIWFFGASKENYLSFRDEPRPERTLSEHSETKWQTKDTLQMKFPFEKPSMAVHGASTAGSRRSASQPSAQRGVIAANGFLAQVFRAPRFHPLLIPAGLALPFSRRRTRRLLGQIIEEDGIALSMDVSQWHRYSLDWRENGVSFEVDDVQVFESSVIPNPPLGLVIWIDNQYAAFTPE